jgi:hypothetical protein
VTVHGAGVVDASTIAALRLFDPSELPDTILITAVTLGESSFGPHATDDPVKRAGRVAVLQVRRLRREVGRSVARARMEADGSASYLSPA